MKRLEGQGRSSAIILPVRRVLAVFLLLVLPLQFAFAAAAPYCALEKVTVASHFGHHEHPDAPAPEPSDEGGDKGKLHECGVCHLGSGQVHPAIVSIAALPAAPVMTALRDSRQPQHLQEPTERPPRMSLA